MSQCHVLLPFLSDECNGLILSHPLGVGKICCNEHTHSPQPSVAVDGHPSLSHGKVHNLNHVQDTLQGRHSVVQPTIVVEIHYTKLIIILLMAFVENEG